MSLIAIALSAALAAAPAGSAASQADNGLSATDKAKAKDLFGVGQKLYKAELYPEAIEKFQAAYAIRPHPVIFFNIAKCYEQLQETGKAMRAYRDYLRLSPEATDKDAVNDSIANLERRLKEKGLNQIIVFADPATAKIEIDGKEVGVSPASAELVSGTHKIAVRAPGYDPVERTFIMSISRVSEMTVNLRAGATPSIPTASSGTTGTTGTTAAPPGWGSGTAAPANSGWGSSTASTTGDAPKKDDLKVATLTPATTDTVKPAAETSQVVTAAPAKKGRVWTWVAGGVAVAALGGGITCGVVSNGAANDLRTVQHSRADATVLANTSTQFATGANIAYGVAAGAAITAVILFFVEK